VFATILAFSIAAALAVPASASIHSATLASSTLSGQAGAEQKLAVGKGVTNASITRDKFDIGHLYHDGGPAIGSINGWALPTTLKITSPWGPRPVVCTKGVGCDSGFHHGDDFAGACGTPFYAASGGTVASITYDGLAGDEIVIDYGQDGISTAYSHMFDDGIFVQVGQKVLAGDNIGAMGSTGDSTGCHLYFEYRIDNVTVDPVPAMAEHGITLNQGR
jgi:murein DD-endopeptidase MepM/ murein hydrolase activator NlpD